MKGRPRALRYESKHGTRKVVHRTGNAAKVIGDLSPGIRVTGLTAGQFSAVDALELQGARAPIAVCRDNPMIAEDIQLFNQALSEEGERLGERFRVLAAALKELGY